MKFLQYKISNTLYCDIFDSNSACKTAAIILETIDKNSELDYGKKKEYIDRLVNVARATHTLMYLYQYATDENITIFFSSIVVQVSKNIFMVITIETG